MSSAFFDDVANGALPIAIGLVLFAAMARAVLWVPVDDPPAKRVARKSLEPLSTWSLVALFIYVVALAAAARMTLLSLVVPLIVAAAAVLLRPSVTSKATRPAEAAEAPAREAPAREAPAREAPRAAAPATNGSLWANPAREDEPRAGGLWSR